MGVIMQLDGYICYALVGAFCTLLVGMTGCGGGSLMTPLLILCGQNPVAAVGTDLLYASLSKGLFVWRYNQLRVIHWRAVGLLCLGAVPVTLIISIILHFLPHHKTNSIVLHFLGVMLLLSAFLMVNKKRLVAKIQNNALWFQKYNPVLTIISGGLLGISITLTSVGAGTIGVFLILMLYPWLSPLEIVGTDLAQGIPITLVAGIGHLTVGDVNFPVLISLLAGSVPAAFLATFIAPRIPERILQLGMASVLCLLGANFLIPF